MVLSGLVRLTSSTELLGLNGLITLWHNERRDKVSRIILLLLGL